MVFPEKEISYEGIALPRSKARRKEVVFLFPLSPRVLLWSILCLKWDSQGVDDVFSAWKNLESLLLVMC